MLKHDRLTRDLLAERLREAVDETVTRQLRREAQEPPITSKVATEIEHQLNGICINGYRVRVVAQDFADRGPKSDEWLGGADLYIAIEVDGSASGLPVIAKGLLIQAKKARTYKRLPTRRAFASWAHQQRQLVEQCEKMLERTTDNAAFVWLYGSRGARVVPAREVVSQPAILPEALLDRSVVEQFGEVLDCFQGDPNLIAPDIFTSDSSLGAFMKEIAAKRAVAIRLALDAEA